jgi:hypothetical protein
MKKFAYFFASILVFLSLSSNAQTLKYMLVDSFGNVVFKDLDRNGCLAHLGNKAKDGWSCVPQQ